jgi:hypothetical protein
MHDRPDDTNPMPLPPVDSCHPQRQAARPN